MQKKTTVPSPRHSLSMRTIHLSLHDDAVQRATTSPQMFDFLQTDPPAQCQDGCETEMMTATTVQYSHKQPLSVGASANRQIAKATAEHSPWATVLV